MLIKFTKKWKDYKCMCVSAIKIQRMWRLFDIRDPITLCKPIVKICIVRGNVKHMYDAKTLFSYIINTGDYRDPIARMEFNDCELMRIDHKNGNVGRFLIKKKNMLLNMRQEDQLNENLCDALENEFNDYVQQIRNRIAEETMTSEVFSTEMIPQIFQCYENYKAANYRRCKDYLISLCRSLNNDPLSSIEFQIQLHHLVRVLIIYCETAII